MSDDLPFTHYFMVKDASGRRRRMPCRIVKKELRQGYRNPYEVDVVEYRLGDGQIVQGTIERWMLYELKAS